MDLINNHLDYKLITSRWPSWIPMDELNLLVKYIQTHPTWWLKHGCSFKYLNIRFDSRSGNGLITTDPELGTDLWYIVGFKMKETNNVK